MRRFVAAGVVLQLAMVVSGHYSDLFLSLAAPLGVGIPLVLAVAYGVTGPREYRAASVGGLAIGFVGAFFGVLLAILLGDQPWSLITFAPLSSGVAGVFGAVVGLAVTTRGRHG